MKRPGLPLFLLFLCILLLPSASAEYNVATTKPSGCTGPLALGEISISMSQQFDTSGMVAGGLVVKVQKLMLQGGGALTGAIVFMGVTTVPAGGNGGDATDGQGLGKGEYSNYIANHFYSSGGLIPVSVASGVLFNLTSTSGSTSAATNRSVIVVVDYTNQTVSFENNNGGYAAANVNWITPQATLTVGGAYYAFVDRGWQNESAQLGLADVQQYAGGFANCATGVYKSGAMVANGNPGPYPPGSVTYYGNFSLPPPSPFSLTFNGISATEAIARWPIQMGSDYYHFHVGTSGFTVSGSSYVANATGINAAVSGLSASTAYCARVVEYVAGAVYVTSAEACTNTTPQGLAFTGNRTRVVPDNVTLYVTRNTAQNIIIDCIRVDSNGALQSACTADLWPASDGDNNYTFRYPQSVVVNTTSGMVGTYHVFAADPTTGAYLGGATFMIQSSWANLTDIPIGSDVKTQIAGDAVGDYNAATTAQAEAVAIASETSVRQLWLNFLTFALSDDIFAIPNLAWWWLACLILAAMGVSRGKLL